MSRHRQRDAAAPEAAEDEEIVAQIRICSKPVRPAVARTAAISCSRISAMWSICTCRDRARAAKLDSHAEDEIENLLKHYVPESSGSAGGRPPDV